MPSTCVSLSMLSLFNAECVFVAPASLNLSSADEWWKSSSVRLGFISADEACLSSIPLKGSTSSFYKRKKNNNRIWCWYKNKLYVEFFCMDWSDKQTGSDFTISNGMFWFWLTFSSTAELASIFPVSLFLSKKHSNNWLSVQVFALWMISVRRHWVRRQIDQLAKIQ